jgi:rubrerythrin
MCSVGGPADIEIEEGVQGKSYICNTCGEKFETVGKRPMCPSCQSEDVTPA